MLKLGLSDFILIPIYLIIIYAVGLMISRNLCRSKNEQKLFLVFLSFKITGALSMALIYMYYYGYGDTFRFYRGAEVIYKAFYSNPLDGLRLLLLSPEHYTYNLERYFITLSPFLRNQLFYLIDSSRQVVQLAGFFNLFAFNNYMVLNIILAFFSTFGTWKLYQLFTDLYPEARKGIVISILFFPSLIFWGSGLLKDTFVFAFMGFLTYYLFQLFYYKRIKISFVLYSLGSAYLIYMLKPYVIMAFLPSLILIFMIQFMRSRKNSMVRILIAPIVIIGGIAAATGVVYLLGSRTNFYTSPEQIIKYSRIVQADIYYNSEKIDGSSYTLGPVDYSALGILKKAPLATFTTLFRPFVWEVRNSVMFLSSLENLAVMLLVVFVLFRAGPVRFLRIIGRDPVLMVLLFYTLIFSFAIGFTTYNFGTLVRYKIPSEPFFVMIFFIVESRLVPVKNPFVERNRLPGHPVKVKI